MSGAISARNRRGMNAATATGAALGGFCLEQLEARRLFYGPMIAVDIAEGIVTVHGTADRDLMVVRQMANWNGAPTIRIDVQSEGYRSDGGFGYNGGVRYFNRNDVKEIRFEGGGGDDVAYCQTIGIDEPPLENVDVPLFLDGGDGNDTLLGGARDDTIVGGAGKDWLEGGAIRNAYALNLSYWTGQDNGLKPEQFSADAGGNMLGGSAGHDLLIADLQTADGAAEGSANVPDPVAASMVIPTAPAAAGASIAGSLSSFFKDEDSGLLN